jgi:hypothetical protein
MRRQITIQDLQEVERLLDNPFSKTPQPETLWCSTNTLNAFIEYNKESLSNWEPSIPSFLFGHKIQIEESIPYSQVETNSQREFRKSFEIFYR